MGLTIRLSAADMCMARKGLSLMSVGVCYTGDIYRLGNCIIGASSVHSGAANVAFAVAVVACNMTNSKDGSLSFATAAARCSQLRSLRRRQLARFADS